MNFTKEQELAYKAYSTNYLISAGAGSGKTQVLSERVRYLVQEKGFHINEFLILTFTKLAAGEMKQRIRKKLKEINSPEADLVDSAYICTFDSFALSLVKKYHYRLNLTKNVSMIDENIIQILIKKKIEETLENLYNSNDKTLISFVNKYCFKNDNNLVDLLFSLYNEANSSINTEQYFNNLIIKSDTSFLNKFLLNYSQELDNIFEDFCLVADNCPDKKYQDWLSSLIDNYNFSETLDEKVNSLKVPFKAARNMEEYKLEYDENKEKLKSFIENYTCEQDLFDSFNLNKEYTLWLINITKDIINFDKQFKYQHQSFSFNDIAKFAIELIKNNEDIRLEIKSSLKTIMIDEYQDTSLIQETLINMISNNNVYMVGDVKQSIYRFRKATPALFIEKFSSYQNHINGELISMQDNFRSRKEVLDDINIIFSQIMTLPLGGADYKKDHIIRNGNKLYACGGLTNHSNNMDYIYYEGKSDIEFEAKLIAEDIIKKINEGYLVFNGNFSNPGLRKAKLSDFCILLDRGTSFYIFEKIFKAYKIPLFIEDNVDVSTKQIGLTIISLIKVISYIQDNDYSSDFKHALISLMRSFIFNYNDDKIYHLFQNDLTNIDIVNEIKSIIKQNPNYTNYELIFNIIHHFRTYQKLVNLGDVKVNEKYLDNFLLTIKNLNEIYTSLNEFVDYFNSLNLLSLSIDIPSSTSTFDSVKIMNIFKSKGLEFPIIYCAGLGKEFNQDKYKKDFIISQEFGLIYPNSNFNKTIIFDKYKALDQKEELSEKIRLLYVELTRAKEQIICLLPEKLSFKGLEKANSLGALLIPCSNLFNQIHLTKDDLNNNTFSYISNNDSNKKLFYKELNIEPILKNKNIRASKDLSMQTNYEFIEKGEHLHLLLECIDFLNPQLDKLNHFDQRIVKNFLNTEIIKNLKNPLFYKEYEFFTDEVNGIIDLLIIDNDKAYIVDYKLKNISDEKYKKQLKVYYDYVNQTFKLKTKCYLYSILGGTLQEINF